MQMMQHIQPIFKGPDQSSQVSDRIVRENAWSLSDVNMQPAQVVCESTILSLDELTYLLDSADGLWTIVKDWTYDFHFIPLVSSYSGGVVFTWNAD
jgi:hypothetical protein